MPQCHNATNQGFIGLAGWGTAEKNTSARCRSRWTTTDEEGLDKVLIPFFWAEVNPRLKHPF